jgi:hypothetical protein
LNENRQGLIPNCRLAFQCPREWTAMLPTADDQIRFCGECKRAVYYCDSDDLLRTAALNGWCVAIPVEGENGDVLQLSGIPSSPGDWR